MAALDLLGRRWALRLLWELRRGPRGPRELLASCPGLSSSVLYVRLRELAAAGLVVGGATDGYALTPRGSELGRALDPLDRWARRWAEDGADGGPPPEG